MSSLSSDPSAFESPPAHSHYLPSDLPANPGQTLKKKRSFFSRRPSKASKSASESSSTPSVPSVPSYYTTSTLPTNHGNTVRSSYHAGNAYPTDFGNTAYATDFGNNNTHPYYAHNTHSYYGHNSHSHSMDFGSTTHSHSMDYGNRAHSSFYANNTPRAAPAAVPPTAEQKVEVSLINLGIARFYKVKVTGPNGKKVGYTPAPRPPRKPRA